MPSITPATAPIPSPILSPTLAANEFVRRLRAEGREVLHMGFGQAPFPVHPRLARALSDNAGENGYPDVAGMPELRAAVLAHQAAIAGIDPDAYDVLVAPGSKLILFAVQMALGGDPLLPVPSWVSYEPQARLLGRRAIPVPARCEDRCLVIDADDLAGAIARARGEGRDPRSLVLNSPSNPTGLVVPDDCLAAIAAVCGREGVAIVSDEIYARLTFDGSYPTIARHAPDRTIVSTGLSKHLSLGGWRLGVGLVPKSMDGLFARLVSFASETWSGVAAPVQRAAVEAYRMYDDVEASIDAARRVHRSVATLAARRLKGMGLDCAMPGGGFYVWPDLAPVRRAANREITSSALAGALLRERGVVSLPGSAFGEEENALRLRLSVCDYDGADALSHLARGGDPDEVGAYAPRATRALDAIEAFVAAPRFDEM